LSFVDISVIGEYEIPTVATVLAPIGNDVALEPPAIFTWWGDEKTSSTTIDTDDFLFWYHLGSLPVGGAFHGAATGDVPLR
jgi:hypothetical protein